MKSDGKIIVLDMICFEYLILAFDRLVSWTGMEKTDKVKIRENVLRAIENHRIDLSKIEDEKINTVKRNTKKFINYDRKKRLGLMQCSKIKVVKYFWGSYNGLATENLKAQKKRNCLPVPQ